MVRMHDRDALAGMIPDMAPTCRDTVPDICNLFDTHGARPYPIIPPFDDLGIPSCLLQKAQHKHDQSAKSKEDIEYDKYSKL